MISCNCPLCPPTQSWNWDYDVFKQLGELDCQTTETRINLIDFNNGDFPDGQNDFIHEATMRDGGNPEVDWSDQIQFVQNLCRPTSGQKHRNNTITTDTSAVGVLEIWVEDTTGGFGTVNAPKNVWKGNACQFVFWFWGHFKSR